MTAHSRLATILCPLRPLALGGGDYALNGKRYVLTQRDGSGAVLYHAADVEAWLDHELPPAELIEESFESEVKPIVDPTLARLFLVFYGVAICKRGPSPYSARPVLDPTELFAHALQVTTLPEIGVATLVEYPNRFRGLHITLAHIADASWAARTGQYTRCMESLRAAERAKRMEEVRR